MAEVEANFESLKKNVGVLEWRLDDVERRLQSDENGTRAIGDSFPWELQLSQGRTDQPVTKLARYWKARKSLRLWPVKGEGDDLRIELQKFLTHKLRLGEDVVADTRDCSIRRIPSSQK